MVESFLRRCVGRSAGATVFLLLVLGVGTVRAQMLTGQWVEQAQQQIDQHRKTEIRIIVFDWGGRHVADALVRIEQVRHAFPVGFHLSESGWPGADGAAPIWRCFNAVSLERLTAWLDLETAPASPLKTASLDEAVARGESLGLMLRWGGVISADPGLNPTWVGYLHGEKLRAALEAHIKRVLLHYGGRVDHFDLYTHRLDHDWIEQQLGLPMVRRLHEHAKAAAPRAAICARFTDALIGDRGIRMAHAASGLDQDFVPVDRVAIDQRIGGMVVQASFKRAVDRLGRLGHRAVIAGLEVGGATPVQAAINLETVIRTLFAAPRVDGIWYSALTAAEAVEPHSALFDDEGRPSPVGQMFDKLWRELWWTDDHFTTDELGNVYARVYAGTHKIIATLPDGEVLHTTVWLPRTDGQRVIVLEPLRSTVP